MTTQAHRENNEYAQLSMVSPYPQRAFMNRVWQPPPWLERSTLTPMADYAAFSSLIYCRNELPRDLSNLSLLIVNCGWGVDTHFFQTEGAARITATDLSERALALAVQHCEGIRTVLAATEYLPFPDASFDWVGVRSGLHHLDDPFHGLAEMVRVARVGFFFIEAQETPLTPLLVRLGFLEAEEEGGNKVYRFNRNEVATRLERLGVHRYRIGTRWFMQLPALVTIARSFPGRLPALVLRTFVFTFNLFFRRLGNAMVVVAFKQH